MSDKIDYADIFTKMTQAGFNKAVFSVKTNVKSDPIVATCLCEFFKDDKPVGKMTMVEEISKEMLE